MAVSLKSACPSSSPNTASGKTSVPAKKSQEVITATSVAKRSASPNRGSQKKYYSSVLNLRDFLAENIGQEFTGIVAKSLDANYRRYHH